MTEERDLTKFNLECGVTLDLQPVNYTVIDGIRSRMYESLADDNERLRRARELARKADRSTDDVMQLFAGNMAVLNAVGANIFRYCVGWGVTNDPPEQNTEEMDLLGAPPDKPHIRRAEWIRTLLSDLDEANRLVDQIQRLSR